MDLKQLPLTRNKLRDDLSAFIFLSYASEFDSQAKKKLRSLANKELIENQLAYPIQKEFVKNFIDKKIKIKSSFNPDNTCSLIHGVTAGILRGLHCPLNDKNLKRIRSLIIRLDEISYVQEDRIFWLNFIKLHQDEHPTGAIGLSLHRGLGGVIAVLSICYQQGIEKKRSLRLLEGAINQVLYIDKIMGKTELPGYWGNSKISIIKRTTPSYGDVAIGYAITLAGYRCRNTTWQQVGKQLFKRGIKRTPKNAGIKNPYFSEGASGLSHLAYKYYELTGDESVHRHSERWMIYADRLYKKKFMHFEMHVEASAYMKLRSAMGKTDDPAPANLHNSSLGYFLCKWYQEGLIDAHWDSMYGLSNPITRQTL